MFVVEGGVGDVPEPGIPEMAMRSLLLGGRVWNFAVLRGQLQLPGL